MSIQRIKLCLFVTREKMHNASSPVARGRYRALERRLMAQLAVMQ